MIYTASEVFMIRILIADPDPATRKALALLLKRKWGAYDVKEVQDVETLIRALADSSPDLLLLDWHLYDSPAPETCQLLRKAYPRLSIVLLSVNADDAQAAKEAGADFIHKGAVPDELMLVLHEILKKKKQ